MPHIEFAIGLIFIAAFIRGYTGFGFAAIAISGLSLIWPIQVSVPVILTLDLISSVGLISTAWHHAHKPLLKHLSLGAVVGIPIGLMILIKVPDPVLKFALSLTILCMIASLIYSSSITLPLSSRLTSGVGCISGGFSAAASIGGLPVVCYLLMTGFSASIQRATLVIFLTASDVISVGLMAFNDILTVSLISPILWLLVPSLIGVQVGQWFFTRKPPQSFRPIALPILITLSSISLYFSSMHIFK
ncbi:hypothetical protein OA92_15685 [Marinomonas sp. SBI22]|uniref:sulfite exporter TauE/SafE family protein n=1 Tax=unclassified Marinomonas TaxID=196814 RepID=UPI0007AF1B47|nr:MULTISPECIES: sulfite exporter TauE/SafE family protein [unclassified Marinomonas]KZM41010.1 hypothetical protein OA92_15685 [Marinomonas sp. SBI22]KZM42850.1 hypothetical protein OA91_13885 [Marinomonas sp. SBI8L]